MKYRLTVRHRDPRTATGNTGADGGSIPVVRDHGGVHTYNNLPAPLATSSIPDIVTR